jgi:hypothetical protein
LYNIPPLSLYVPLGSPQAEEKSDAPTRELLAFTVRPLGAPQQAEVVLFNIPETVYPALTAYKLTPTRVLSKTKDKSTYMYTVLLVEMYILFMLRQAKDAVNPDNIPSSTFNWLGFELKVYPLAFIRQGPYNPISHAAIVHVGKGLGEKLPDIVLFPRAR